MENTSHNEFENYSSSELLMKIKDFSKNGIDKTNHLIEELKNRGFADQVEEIEQSLISKHPIYSKFWRRVFALHY